MTDLNVLFTLTLGVLLLAFLDTKKLEKALGSFWSAAGFAALSVLFYLSRVHTVAYALIAAAVIVFAARLTRRFQREASQAARFILFSFPFFWLLRRNIPLPGGGDIHFSFDYGIYALVFFAALYWAKTPRRSAVVMVAWGLWTFFGFWPEIAFTAAAAALVSYYNGQRGRNDHRLFYWAYPAHLFLLWGLLALLA